MFVLVRAAADPLLYLRKGDAYIPEEPRMAAALACLPNRSACARIEFSVCGGVSGSPMAIGTAELCLATLRTTVEGLVGALCGLESCLAPQRVKSLPRLLGQGLSSGSLCRDCFSASAWEVCHPCSVSYASSKARWSCAYGVL